MVAPMIAALGVALLAAAGLALDVGLYYAGNRELRMATEAAAMAAAVEPTQARSRAETYLRANGYDPSVIKSLEVGYYCANDDLKAATNGGSRFVAAGALDPNNCAGSRKGPNAVRLTAGKTSRQFLSGALGSASPIPELAATASAARIDEAGIAATSDLLGLTAGGVTSNLLDAVNGLLGALLNIRLNLTGPDVRALMRNNVDAGKFFDALAKRTGKTGTYAQLLSGSYGMRDVAYAAADAATDGTTATVLRTIGTAAGNGYLVPMDRLFGVGVWKNMPVGQANVQPSLRAGINAYQLITYAAQAGPGAIDLSDAVSLVVPNSTVAIRAVATGPMDRPRFAFGPALETSAGTSILRLQVDVKLVNLSVADIVNAEANVPLLIDVQASDATISNIDCAFSTEQRDRTKVTLAVNSGLVNVYLGKLTNAAAMTKSVPTLRASDFAQEDILKLRLQILFIGLDVVSVQGRAAVQPVVGGFRQRELGPGGRDSVVVAGQSALPSQYSVLDNRAQIGTTVQGLTTSLLGPGGLKACTLSLICVSNDTKVIQTVSSVLNTVGNVLGNTADPLLDNVLAALGIQLGSATVWTTGARCGVPVLI
ncbi:MAG TPA: TadG family pilus assembly protein [Novosphingobium sp.]|nr:TadG family pilus assembly protein [Novosphingobium sp.]